MNRNRLSHPARVWLNGLASHRRDVVRIARGEDVQGPGLDEVSLIREALHWLGRMQRWRFLYEREVRAATCGGTRVELAEVILKMEYAYVGDHAVTAQLKEQEWRSKGAKATNKKRTLGLKLARGCRLIQRYEEITGMKLTPESPAGVRRNAADHICLSERHLLRVLRARAKAGRVSP
jgi:hypothetical protein